MTNAATRLITLIMLLQRQPNQKAAALADELGVSVRSLHRYIHQLEEMGIPIYSERGPKGGFSLARGYRMPPLVFTAGEAVAVYLGTSLVGQLWGQLYEEAARGALVKVDNVLPDEQRHEVAWARRTLVATGLHRAQGASLASHLEKLRQAVRDRRRLQMLYRGRGRPEPSERELEPYALVHRWGWWYVVGYCRLRRAVRTFRVDRIVDLALTGETFSVPADFDVHTYLASESDSQPSLQARLLIAPEAAISAADNRFLWESMEERSDGSIEVVLNVPDLEWAASLALSFGPAVTALEPDELRQRIGDYARAIAQKYGLETAIDRVEGLSESGGLVQW